MPFHKRTRAAFGNRSKSAQHSGTVLQPVTIAQGVQRVRAELALLRADVDAGVVISSNLALRLDGFPRSDQREPGDPGGAVYWLAKTATRCIAIDRYDRVADNLAAIAATLDAMRAIERHGGAAIVDRAFTGFTALPAPESNWRAILGACVDLDEARANYRRLRSLYHPDNGGDPALFHKVERAWEAAQIELGGGSSNA